jgi:hypothetical protein
MAKVSLLDFWNSNEVSSLWVSGSQNPVGKTYVQNLDEDDCCDLNELIDNGLSIEAGWDLVGNVVENGSWVWDGQGDFRDAQGNSYCRMQVFVKDSE